MIRKLFVLGLIGSSLGFFVFGKDLGSYFRTFSGRVHKSVKNEIPIEFEVQRAKDTVDRLMPEIHNAMHVIAEQQVEVEHLSTELSVKETGLDRQRQTILAMRTKMDEKPGETVLVIQGKTCRLEQVEEDLARRFQRFKIAEEALKYERQYLTSREKLLEANRQKFVNLLSEKRDLELQVAQLEARLKTVQAAETVSQLTLDGSELSRAKQLITDLNKQLDVKQKLLDQEGNFSDLIPFELEEEKTSHQEIGKEIDAYFQSGVVNKAPDVDEKSMARSAP
jgi:predicted  nucleic acid-binding Zn-ribbon protein